MPDTICSRCGRIGLVRKERIIKGGDSRVGYYCGACHHTWEADEAGHTLKSKLWTRAQWEERRALLHTLSDAELQQRRSECAHRGHEKSPEVKATHPPRWVCANGLTTFVEFGDET